MDISSNPIDEKLDSSPETNSAEAQTQENDVDVDDSLDSSPEKKSMLDVVEAVLSNDSKEEEVSESDTKDEDEKSDSDGDDKEVNNSKDGEDGSDNDIPSEFHKHPRWNKLKEQRDEARKQVEMLKVGNDKHQKLQTFMRQNSITDSQSISAFEIMAHINNGRFQEALDLILPTVNELNKLTGNVLPADLVDKVNQGYIDDETANELARNRGAIQANKIIRDKAIARQNQNAQQQAYNNIMSAAQQTIINFRNTDPDFSKKEKLVMDKVTAISVQQGVPRTPEDAKARLDAAYKEVNELFGTLTEREPRTLDNPSPKSAKVAPPRKPTSMLEAVEAGLGK